MKKGKENSSTGEDREVVALTLVSLKALLLYQEQCKENSSTGEDREVVALKLVSLKALPFISRTV
ncbi:hypothetical protein M3699_09440 [Peribacillus simplex]|uniref:hypothetical protein n=1 Tax=Peribacillus simplex TaxID=1478 RepID=UPI00203D065E|nr:hypothetical protein [Peribacillus simplex]MCM3674103.1 hypothetical protein [Peribacillus simplex]